MPVIGHIPLTFNLQDVLRQEGLPGYSQIKPEIRTFVSEVLAGFMKSHLLEPAIAYQINTITELRRRQPPLEGKPTVHDSLLSSVLHRPRELAVTLCTIGPRLERQVTDCTSQSEPLRGVLLDGIGSTAVDSLTEDVYKLIAEEASSRGYDVSDPINAGMPGLPISRQWQLLKLVPAEEIAVSLTSSEITVPRKSVSIVIGVGLIYV
jgi:hypothetical protein